MVELKEGVRNGDAHGGKRPVPKPAPPEETEQVVLTLSAPKGELVKVERVEKNGQRRELSQEEITTLAGTDDLEDLEAALEEAYGGGILDALGEEEEDADEEEVALRRLLVARLLGRRLVRRRLRHLVFRRALRRQLQEERGRR